MIDSEYPESKLPEHRELREILTRAMNAGGRTALAADGVRRVLYPHMRLEEAFAAPPLSLLPKLAAGEITPEMEKIIEVSAMLKLQLPRMLEQHRMIVTALQDAPAGRDGGAPPGVRPVRPEADAPRAAGGGNALSRGDPRRRIRQAQAREVRGLFVSGSGLPLSRSRLTSRRASMRISRIPSPTASQ